jgi:CHASE3 domain sensor protein
MATLEKTADRPFGLAALFGAAAVLLIITGVVIYWSGLVALRANQKRVTQASLLLHLDEFLATLEEAETGQRGTF